MHIEMHMAMTKILLYGNAKSMTILFDAFSQAACSDPVSRYHLLYFSVQDLVPMDTLGHVSHADITVVFHDIEGY